VTGHRSAAEIELLFKTWIIPHSRADSIMRVMEKMREHKRKLPWGVEARGAHLLAPSHSGKTHAVYTNHFQTYILPECRKSGRFALDVPADDIKRLQTLVAFARIPSAYDGAVVASLLEALGDPRPYKGSVDERFDRAFTIMSSQSRELLVLDSFDNLNRAGDIVSERKADATRGRLRTLIERGMPILFLGIPSARDSILKESQLTHRSDEVEFAPLTLPKDELEYGLYLTALDLLMVHHGIFAEESDLTKYFYQLFVGSRNRLGVTSLITMKAAISASAEKRPHIQERHLSDAVVSYIESTPRDFWVPADLLHDINPFTNKHVAFKGASFW
jgi:hypothetical protein